MDKKKFEQFKKGILPLLILQILNTGTDYGYNIVSRFNELGGTTLSIKEGTLYPILYRLEKEGAISGEWQMSSDNSKPKKYYTITPSGQKMLSDQWEAWKRLEKAVNLFEKN